MDVAPRPAASVGVFNEIARRPSFIATVQPEIAL
jgi:hypothetical protein